MSITFGEALRYGVKKLREADIPTPERDVRELVGFVCGVDLTQLFHVAHLTPSQWEQLQTLLDERARRVPLQHLTGVAHFRRISLHVGPGVFVPRPETELLVQWGLDTLTGVVEPIVIDACAGSGAIALSMTEEKPGARIYAIERERSALAWLHQNTEDIPVRVCKGDATAPHTLAELDSQVDVVLSNPPYVPLESYVAPEAAEHDPPAALWGGRDGLDTVRALAARAHAWLRPGGWFGCEHGEQHADAAREILRESGFVQVETLPDLTGRPRFSVGQHIDLSPRGFQESVVMR